MGRVDFYILPDSSNHFRFVCSLTGKAWQNGNRVFIHTMNREDAVMLDDMLWTFKDISFIPHAIMEKNSSENAPVLIGWNHDEPVTSEVLINLCDTIPDYAANFERIVEIVAGSPQQKQLARNRYRDYRERGYELHDHKIEGDYDNT